MDHLVYQQKLGSSAVYVSNEGYAGEYDRMSASRRKRDADDNGS